MKVTTDIDTDTFPLHRPDFTNTEPAVDLGPHPQWADPKKIVAMDPLGHLAPFLFADTIKNDKGTATLVNLRSTRHLCGPTTECLIVDIRPTIAITRAHMKVSLAISIPTNQELDLIPMLSFPILRTV